MAVLVVVQGTERETFEVSGGEILGRGAGSDILIRNRSVSRNHVRVVKKGRRYAVQDMGSANGTWVNEQRVWRAYLSDWDEIKLGGVRILFHSSEDMLRSALLEKLHRASPQERVVA